ncbi:rod-binding protein [Leptospira noguchii]|uniref:Rod binding protein n=2 Tax=Leptospira noguchii TaxID=28182 RepID=M6UEU6_9LEPT|nr:rod-binding protein [Leptospira noguchii]EMO29785.1 rod binding protein [Leptospira interrogans serovar Bataviae str. HAI135]EMO41356.1 rod binding protein [Leptospira noguchii serovar Autumnalis str. ZUN142]TQE69616.1 cell division protein [Leptospira noguchii]UOG33242.1 rod-binding protein [Leptospira noguchii]UOG38959.1 rod-binding protein [Leptospira noguchii]
MMIDSIKDYSNKLNLIEKPEVKSLLNLEKEGKSKSTFPEILREEFNEKLSGKVSSSEIKLPHNIQDEIAADPYRKKLYSASVEFESIFVKMMLNEMKKTVEKSGLIDGGYAEEIFEDMLYDEYSKNLSSNSSLGLAEQIYQSLSSNLPPYQKIDQKV